MKRIRSETETSSKTGSYVSFSLPASAPFEDEPMERLVYSDIEDEDTYSNDGDGDLSGDWNPESKFRASPKKRRPSKSSVSSRTKELAKARDPNGGICLLTNARKPVVSRQFCHLLARRTTHETLTNLEWKLQMPYWTLNIDTSFNVFALVANWHLAMDDDHWTLMPHHKIISRILEWANNTIKDDPTGYNKDNRTPISESKLYKGKTKFTYYFLALSDDMKDVAITRYNKDFDPKAVENHLHPFSTIGALISHVHPHFVIYSAGDKLAKIEATKRVDEGAWLETLAETASFGHKGDSIAKENLRSLQEIMDIHKLWSSDEDVPQKTDDPRHEWMRHPKELL
ncbi:hypothetical protein C8R44DRAFT_945538 [Mycena epipterygia]|nr:hypothetical protein C8R44DRAFT_945538 [Mycena epipterygia]